MANTHFIQYKQTLLSRNRKWAGSTDIACWHCTYQFEGVPRCVPTNYDHKNACWSVIGCFCTWGCAKAWLIKSKEFDLPINHMELKIMAVKVFNYPFEEIHPAPTQYILERYGGPWTIEDYRRHVNEPTMPPSEILIQPLLPASMAICVGELNEVTSEIAATRHELDGNAQTKEPRGLYHTFLDKEEEEESEEEEEKAKKRTTRSSTRLTEAAKSKSKPKPTPSKQPTEVKEKKKCRGSLAAFRLNSGK